MPITPLLPKPGSSQGCPGRMLTKRSRVADHSSNISYRISETSVAPLEDSAITIASRKSDAHCVAAKQRDSLKLSKTNFDKESICRVLCVYCETLYDDFLFMLKRTKNVSNNKVPNITNQYSTSISHVKLQFFPLYPYSFQDYIVTRLF
jgi:hypothetical protein